MRPCPWLALLCVVSACGGTPPAPDVMQYIRVGVTPADEAVAVREGMIRDGWHLATEVRSERVVAMGFARKEPPGAAVRVVTRHGMALTMDSPSDAWTGSVFVEDALGDTAVDIDGDGNEEVVLGSEDDAVGRRCLEVFHVLPDGTVVPMTTPTVLPFQDPCVVRLTDVVGDRRPEAVAVVQDNSLSFDQMASVEVPLVSLGGHWRRPPAEVLTDFDAGTAAVRERDLGAALGAKHVLKETPHILRLAYELAMLSHLRGDDEKASRDVFLRATEAATFPTAAGKQRDEIAAHIVDSWALVQAAPRP